MFRNYTDLQRVPNSRRRKQDVSYSCDICDEGDWTSETEVDIHKKSKHRAELLEVLTNKKKFGCLVCMREHTDRNTLYNHFKTEHLLSSEDTDRIEREIFICEYCTRIFFNKKLIAVHMKQKHNSHMLSDKVECPKCSKLIKKTVMWNHLERHHVSSVSTCPICVEKMPNRKELRRHLDAHRKYYYCDLCLFETKHQDSFYEHVNVHKKLNVSDDLDYDKYFVPPTIKNRVPQVTVQHPLRGLLLPQGIHVCVVCRHICLNTTEMKKHIASDHVMSSVEKKRAYTCSCGQEFTNSILLKQHNFKECNQAADASDESTLIEVIVPLPQVTEEVEVTSDTNSEEKDP